VVVSESGVEVGEFVGQDRGGKGEGERKIGDKCLRQVVGSERGREGNADREMGSKIVKTKLGIAGRWGDILEGLIESSKT
jgi:hypothetical protein